MRTVIIGAGHAGGTLAAQLRQNEYEGDVVLLGEEPHPPYQRPPLSKAWLKGEVEGDGLSLRPGEAYAEMRIDLRTSTRVVAIDRTARAVILSTDDAVPYDTLVLATGARARRLALPGSELDGFLELRTLDDAEAIKAAFRPGFRLAVVGGGYVGLEVAASARLLGAEVDLFEREERLLARVASSDLSAMFEAVHKANGVHLHLGAAVTGFDGLDGRVSAVRLAGGGAVHCDAVLVGIGAVPNDDLARDAGLDCADGVVVDEQGRTSDPAIFAIGDVTHRPLPLYERSGRLESVPNALEQARQAAAAIAGTAPPKPEVPWFWSDQYDLKLQIAGLPFEVDRVVIRGDPDSRRFAVYHLSGERVQAVEAVNSPPDFMMGRQWIAARRTVDPDRLADVGVPIKTV